MFHRLANHYDDLVGEKDYATEARALVSLVHRFARCPTRTWLDVGCGTGQHLEHLRRGFSVVGLDRSSEMLRLARRRLKDVRLVVGEMSRFRLESTFDVVSCLYSAVGHLRSEAEVARTFANFARHLSPGGVVIVEPWIDPSVFRPGYVQLVTRSVGPTTVARMSVSSRRGNRSVVHYHYLIGRQGRSVEHIEEDVFGLLVPRRRLVALARRAGLSARFVPRGLSPGRGLIVGVKPVTSRARRAFAKDGGGRAPAAP